MSNTETKSFQSQWRHSLPVAMLLAGAELVAYLVVLGARKLTGRNTHTA